MKIIDNFDEYRAMVDVVKMHDYRYFGLNNPTISDEEYDAMYFALQEYEEQHADEVLPDSPTQKCYSENGNGKRTVARRTACLSMKKLHDAKAAVKYLRAQQRAANISSIGTMVAVEWKFDGETVSLVYRQGILAEATYGHGKELFGNDCLEHIKHVQGVPSEVAAWSQYDRVEVRGEVIISLEEFARYGKAGKSPRSTSNGIMAKKVAVKDECKRLEFHPFRIIMDGLTSHMQAMGVLEHIGFNTSGFVSALNLGKSDADLEQHIENIVCAAELERELLPYPTDGLVFKFDNYAYYDRIGQTDHDAKYNCAFKFRPVFKAVTTYRGHHTTVGEKTGKVTYVADFDEVEMNGHRFAHANCGSEKTFSQKALVPGCKIEVSLHGDVIVCVDGKVEDDPVIEDEPIIEEEPITEDEPITEEEPITENEPIIEDEHTIEDEPIIEEEPVIEEEHIIADEPIIEEAPAIADEPIIENEPIIEEEPLVIEQDINQSQEQEFEPEPIPHPKPKCKRNYPQVGEPTLREDCEDNTERKSKGVGVKTVLTGVLSVLMAISTGVVMLALAGAAVLLMPMLGGMTKE